MTDVDYTEIFDEIKMKQFVKLWHVVQCTFRGFVAAVNEHQDQWSEQKHEELFFKEKRT
jgi:hypothetical protein